MWVSSAVRLSPFALSTSIPSVGVSVWTPPFLNGNPLLPICGLKLKEGAGLGCLGHLQGLAWWLPGAYDRLTDCSVRVHSPQPHGLIEYVSRCDVVHGSEHTCCRIFDLLHSGHRFIRNRNTRKSDNWERICCAVVALDVRKEKGSQETKHFSCLRSDNRQMIDAMGWLFQQNVHK